MSMEPIEIRIHFLDVNGAYSDAVGWIVRERLLEAGVPLQPSKVGDPNVRPACGVLVSQMAGNGMEWVIRWEPEREIVPEIVDPAPVNRVCAEPPHAAAVATVIVICLALLLAGLFDDRAVSVAYVAIGLVLWVFGVVPG